MALNLWKPEPKRRSGIVRLPPVVPGVPLTKYTNTELGVRIARRSGQPRQEPGIAWARLMNASNRPEKDAARDAVLDMCSVARFPSLKIFTFPASEWRFEYALLSARGERPDRGPRTTTIHAIERDVAVFRAAVHNIPLGGGDPKRGHVRTPEVPSFASAHVQTAKIGSFLCCAFEDYAASAAREVFHAAWLDFNGQLSPSRLDAIERFWADRVRSLLVVTVLKLHMSDWMWGRINAHGGVEHLLAARLAGSEIEAVRHYGDGAPMVQIALRRTSGSPRLLVVPALTPPTTGETP